MVSKVRIIHLPDDSADTTAFCALVKPGMLQVWILALTSLEKDCACVRLGSAATRQKTRETRYLYFKWLCESCDANCLT